jgi:iron complex outermembrane receptor protein
MCGLIAATMVGAAAQAQTPPPASVASPAPSSSAGGGATTQSGASEVAATVGEVVVQAEKRDVKLRDVPEAVSVVTGDAIAAIGPVNNTSDIIDTVPGARFTNLANPLLSEISIRGSGTERATGADSSVGLYANGVYVGVSGIGGRNIAPIDSFDLDHAEILEGPQSALYGRDAEYGIVNMIAQEPTFSNSGYIDNLYTFQTEQNRETAVINYKINDNWAVRVGAQGIEQSGGFEYNPDTGKYYDTTDGYMLRAQVRYRNDNLDVNLMFERQQLHVPSFWSAYDVQPANATTGYPGISTFPDGFSQNPRVIPHNGTDFAEEDINNVVLSINYNFGWAKLTSTSSWRTLDTTEDIDADYIDVATEIAVQSTCTNPAVLTTCEKGNFPFSQQDDVGHTTTWYEDLHLAGAPVLGGRITWLAGIELMDQPSNALETITGNPCRSSLTPNPVVGQDACSGTPSAPVCTPLVAPFTCPAVVSPYGDSAPNSGDYTSWAPYASLAAKLPWGFTISGEGRYSHDHKTAVGSEYELYTNNVPYPFLTGGSVPTTNYLLDSGNWTYTATISYKIPSPWDDMVYAKAGTGYRVGGFNFGHSPPLLQQPYPAGITSAVNYAPVTPEYNDETSTSYEVGFKGNFTSRVYFTLDTYVQTTKNALAAVGDGCSVTDACLAGNTNYTVNAGETRGSGVEAQVTTALNLWRGVFRLQLDGSSQTAKYVSVPTIGADGEKLNGLPLAGTPVAENPRWLANATLNYSRPITDNVSGFFNMLYHGQWGGIQDPVTTAGVFVPLSDYRTIDLRTGIDVKRLEFALLVNNLTDEIYKMAQFEQVGLNTKTGAPEAIYSQQRLSLPRTIALEATYKW